MEGGTISVREVARALGVSEREALRIIESENLTTVPISKSKFVVSRKAFTNWQKKRSQAPLMQVT